MTFGVVAGIHTSGCSTVFHKHFCTINNRQEQGFKKIIHPFFKESQSTIFALSQS